MNVLTLWLLVTTLCVIGLAAALVVLLVALRRTRRQAVPAPVTDPFAQADADANALRGDPRRLKPGDLVDIRGRSWVVRGSIRLAEGGWSWTEHLLDDAEGTKRWLSVEEAPDLVVTLWTEVADATVSPDKDTVHFGGRRYVLDEAGRATYTASGTTGLDPTGTMRYRDCVATDGALLSFEAYGDSPRWEVARGERLHRSELTSYSQAS